MSKKEYLLRDGLINHIALIDYFNSKNGKIIAPNESELFKNTVEGAKESDINQLAMNYEKIQNNIDNNIKNANSAVAVLQPKTNKVDSNSPLKPEDFDIVYVEYIYPDAEIPSKDELIDRFSNIKQPDNYYGEKLTNGDVVVIYDKDSQTEAYSFKDGSLEKLSGFLNDNLTNKVKGSFVVRVEEDCIRWSIRLEHSLNKEIIPNTYKERATEILDKYLDKFIEVDLKAPFSMISKHPEKNYSIYATKISGLHVNGFNLEEKNVSEGVRYSRQFVREDSSNKGEYEYLKPESKSIREKYEYLPERKQRTQKMSEWIKKIKGSDKKNNNKNNKENKNKSKNSKEDR